MEHGRAIVSWAGLAIASATLLLMLYSTVPLQLCLA